MDDLLHYHAYIQICHVVSEQMEQLPPTLMFVNNPFNSLHGTMCAAFDKGDLLYLRDEEEKKRYAEQELRETESRAFNSMRQKVMSQHADSLADTNPAHMQKLNERMWASTSLFYHIIRLHHTQGSWTSCSPGVAVSRLRVDCHSFVAVSLSCFLLMYWIEQLLNLCCPPLIIFCLSK